MSLGVFVTYVLERTRPTRSDWRIRTRLPLKQVAASGLPDALEFAMAALLEYCSAQDGFCPLLI